MSGADQSLIQTLISEEIRSLVAESIENGACLQAGHCASVIARAYPNCGMSPSDIADQIVEAAVCARIAVEMSRPSTALRKAG